MQYCHNLVQLLYKTNLETTLLTQWSIKTSQFAVGSQSRPIWLGYHCFDQEEILHIFIVSSSTSAYMSTNQCQKHHVVCLSPVVYYLVTVLNNRDNACWHALITVLNTWLIKNCLFVWLFSLEVADAFLINCKCFSLFYLFSTFMSQCAYHICHWYILLRIWGELISGENWEKLFKFEIFCKMVIKSHKTHVLCTTRSVYKLMHSRWSNNISRDLLTKTCRNWKNRF